ncbi:MAG: hypothetical protein L0206_18330 [Actinobacteria bacterium]|nr:hypothetical protein [Actinomycetota bacterium]
MRRRLVASARSGRQRARRGCAAPAGLAVTMLNDQHAYLHGNCDGLAVGDWIGCGIPHPCTAFDEWRSLPLVNETYDFGEFVSTTF